MTHRILITGSRDWPDDGSVGEAVYAAVHDAMYNLGEKDIVVVHGDCPTGADALAHKWAEETEYPVTIERHPADWDKYGKKAGFVRNQEMVHLGADICLAFIKDKSKGATMTERMARDQNIRTITNHLSSTPFKGGFNDL